MDNKGAMAILYIECRIQNVNYKRATVIKNTFNVIKWIIQEPLLLTEYIEQNKVDYRGAFAIIRIHRTE